jgi:hypothetical protein
MSFHLCHIFFLKKKRKEKKRKKERKKERRKKKEVAVGNPCTGGVGVSSDLPHPYGGGLRNKKTL